MYVEHGLSLLSRHLLIHTILPLPHGTRFFLFCFLSFYFFLSHCTVFLSLPLNSVHILYPYILTR